MKAKGKKPIENEQSFFFLEDDGPPRPQTTSTSSRIIISAGKNKKYNIFVHILCMIIMAGVIFYIIIRDC